MFFQQRSYTAPLSTVETTAVHNAYWLQLRLQFVPAPKHVNMRWSMIIRIYDDIESMPPPIQNSDH